MAANGSGKTLLDTKNNDGEPTKNDKIMRGGAILLYKGLRYFTDNFCYQLLHH